jgi:membrane-bound serine protease (ClpP class)
VPQISQVAIHAAYTVGVGRTLCVPRHTSVVLLVGAILLAVFVLPPVWGLAAVIVAAVVEIAEFFFWIWLSRRRGVQAGREALVGKTARVAAECRPDGKVRVEGELWTARCEAGADVGDSVRVEAVDGLTLEVTRID